MNEAVVEGVLVAALSEVLEEVIFEEISLAEVMPKAPFDKYQPLWWAKITSLNPDFGDFYFVVRKDLMVQYTDAALGMIDEIPDEQQFKDNLGELHNTICGRILALSCPEGMSLNLTLPQIGDDLNSLPSSGCVTVAFNAGDSLTYMIVPQKFWSELGRSV